MPIKRATAARKNLVRREEARVGELESLLLQLALMPACGEAGSWAVCCDEQGFCTCEHDSDASKDDCMGYVTSPLRFSYWVNNSCMGIGILLHGCARRPITPNGKAPSLPMPMCNTCCWKPQPLQLVLCDQAAS